MRRFPRGDWCALLDYAANGKEQTKAAARNFSEEEEAQRRRAAASAKVKVREVRRARLLLTSSGLAPRNEATRKELTDERLRPRQRTATIPEEALRHRPVDAIRLEARERFLAATAPYQFALQTRAGAEALVTAIRALTDLDPDLVVLKLDGVGAFDHVRRASCMDELLARPELRALLHFGHGPVRYHAPLRLA